MSWNYFWRGLKLDAVSPDHFITKNSLGEILDERFSKEDDHVYVTWSYKDNPPKQYELKKEYPIAYRDYVGSYKNESTNATIRIKYKKNRIIAKKGILRIPLIPFSHDQFYAPENAALFIFQRNENKAITSFKANASDFRNFNFDKVQ